MLTFIATRIIVVMQSSSTKPDSRVTSIAVVFIVTKDTDSCFGPASLVTHGVEPFPVTIKLQGALRTNQ